MDGGLYHKQEQPCTLFLSGMDSAALILKWPTSAFETHLDVGSVRATNHFVDKEKSKVKLHFYQIFIKISNGSSYCLDFDRRQSDSDTFLFKHNAPSCQKYANTFLQETGNKTSYFIGTKVLNL